MCFSNTCKTLLVMLIKRFQTSNPFLSFDFGDCRVTGLFSVFFLNGMKCRELTEVLLAKT